jgi:hypothetical protein
LERLTDDFIPATNIIDDAMAAINVTHDVTANVDSTNGLKHFISNNFILRKRRDIVYNIKGTVSRDF